MQRRLELTDTVYTMDQLSSLDLDEEQVAVAGRSNVGKSSLINCLAGHRKLARISSTPGKTRSINFFRVMPQDYRLVDLPGYGYAKVSKKERLQWAELIESYITSAKRLGAVAVLLDSRLEPQALDIDMVSYLRQLSIPILPVLTKADKCKQKDQAKRARQWKEILRTGPSPLLFSAKTGRGREELWRMLDEAAGLPASASS